MDYYWLGYKVELIGTRISKTGIRLALIKEIDKFPKLFYPNKHIVPFAFLVKYQNSTIEVSYNWGLRQQQT